MKILMISEKDAANVSLNAIATEFQNSGHIVSIYAPFGSENVLRDFKTSGQDIHNFAELTENVVMEYDVIFSSVFSLKWLYDKGLFGIKRFIFTHDYLLHGEMTYGGDFSFATALNNTASPYQELLNFGKMGIGEPKYDALKYNANCTSNMLLFIDSGHYPFGVKGRKALAETLVKICKEFPEYELWVKPRFLPTDSTITHYNGVHLYDAIKDAMQGQLPPNLVLLKEHRDLQELINASHTVICMYTTAYISASLADKGLVILEGLPNEDCFDQRNKRKLIFRDRMKSSGALINYKDVCSVLPDGIKCSKNHMDEFLCQKENVAKKIVEVVADIYERFLKHNTFPQNQKYEYQAGCENIVARKGGSWEEILTDRYENYLKYRILISFDYRINADVKVENILSPIEQKKRNGLLLYEDFKCLMGWTDQIVFEGVVANQDILMKDPIDCGILLHAYYWTKKNDELLNFVDKSLGAYNYFVGRMYFDIKDEEKGASYLEKYIEISEQVDFIREISDMPNNKMLALKLLVRFFYVTGNRKKTDKYLRIWRSFFAAMNPGVKGIKDIKDSTTSYYAICMAWSEAQVTGLLERKCSALLDNKKIAIYGAGRVTKELLLQNDRIRQQTIYLFDQFTNASKVMNFPVVRLNEERAMNEVDIVIVTPTFDFDFIFSEIRMLYPHAEVLPVWELIE